MLGLDHAIDELIEEKSIREWHECAVAAGKKVGEYVDGLILEFITNMYNRGVLTRTEYDRAREEWGV